MQRIWRIWLLRVFSGVLSNFFDQRQAEGLPETKALENIEQWVRKHTNMDLSRKENPKDLTGLSSIRLSRREVPRFHKEAPR